MGVPLNQAQGAGSFALPPAGDLAQAVVSGTLTAVGPGKAYAFQGVANVAVWGSVGTSLATTANSLSATVGSATSIAAGVAINSTVVPYGTTVNTIVSTTVTLALPSQSYQGSIDAYGVISGITNTQWLQGATVTTTSTGVTLPAGTTVASIVQASAPGAPGVVKLSAAPTSGPSLTGAIFTPNVPAGPIPFDFQIAAAGLATGSDASATFTGAAISYSATVQLERSFDGGKTWTVANIGSSGTLAQWTAGTPLNLSWTEPERGVAYRLNCVAYTSGTINYRLSQTAGAALSLTTGGVAN